MAKKKDRLLSQLLYGSWRPWTREGATRFMEVQRDRRPVKKHSQPPLLSEVDTPEPEGRIARAYEKYIAEYLSKWYGSAIESIESRGETEDQKYHYAIVRGDLQNLLLDIPSIRQRIRYHPEEKENPISKFVMEVVSLRLANLLLDLQKRYPAFNSQVYSEADIYLELLDRRPPDPSPHWPTVIWHRQQSNHYLHKLATTEGADEPLISGITDVMDEIDNRLSGMGGETTDFRTLAALFHHLENALFLWKMETSFLERHPERLCEADFCREWVKQMITNLVAGEDDKAIHQRFQQLIGVRSWFDLHLSHHRSGGEYPLSEAGRWVLLVEQLMDSEKLSIGTSEDEEVSYGAAGNGAAENEISAFVKFFQETYVHKQEVEIAMGINHKTLKKYLDMAEKPIKRLRLKQNVWYHEEDLKRFLEKHTEM